MKLGPRALETLPQATHRFLAIVLLLGAAPLEVAALDCNFNGVQDSLELSPVHYQPEIRETHGPLPTVRDVAAADLDGDDVLDLAVAVGGAGAVALFRGRGSGEFAGRHLFPAGRFPVAIVAADLDRDGRSDLATANLGGDTVSLLRNQGGGSFAPPIALPAGSNPSALVTLDADGDGQLDLAAAATGTCCDWAESSVMVFASRGGAWEPPAAYGVGAEPVALAAGDLDGDGRPELLSANAAGRSLSVLWNRGGRFEEITDISLEGAPRSLVTADIDKDGDLDLAVGEIGLHLWANDGSGALAPSRPMTTGRVPRSLTAADLDGNGEIDLLYCDPEAGNVTAVERMIGTWVAAPSLVGLEPLAAAVGSFDGSGPLDLAVADRRTGLITVLAGRLRPLSPDCNGDAIPDECNLRRFRADCDGNGVLDVCEPTGSRDCDRNGVADACETRPENDCNENGILDLCDIENGVLTDCNFNGVPDTCPGETSLDCDGDGVLDLCEAAAGTLEDCNGNGREDACDVTVGASFDLDHDSVPDECVGAAGFPDLNGDRRADSLQDCNLNGFPDPCDVASGRSADCGENGIPDECEADCNANDIADDCDLTTGTSTDRNHDGVPDECQRRLFPQFHYLFAGPDRVDAELGSTVEFPLDVLLTTFLEDPGEGGAQGWALAGRGSGSCRFTAGTTEGTAAALEAASPPGLRRPISFERTELVDEAVLGDGTGFTSGVVLALLEDVWLDPREGPHRILRATVAAQVPAGGMARCLFVFEPVPSRPGIPVENLVTYRGESYPATVWPRTVGLRALEGGEDLAAARACSRTLFHRGDPDGDGVVNLTDGIIIFRYLFGNGRPPPCLESADANNSGEVDLSDGVFLLRFLFLPSAPAPPAPGPPGTPCGVDPDPRGSAGNLGCERYEPC